MKKYLSLSFVVFALSIDAANLTVGWDANPLTDGVERYFLYSLVGTNRIHLQNTMATSVPIVLTNGMWKLSVTASNVHGESDLSLPIYLFVAGSNVVAITAKPGAPINLQLR